jgi:hypothetical protein
MVTRRRVLGAMVLVLMVGAGLSRWRQRAKPPGITDEAAAVAAPESAQAPPMTPRRAKANADSVVEAVRTHTHPERLSPLIAPTPFDRAAWEANPQGYLDVVEPGRCYRTAESPGPETPQLKPASSHLVHSAPGGKVHVMVMGAPNAPVTFTAFAGGEFAENGLNSISVKSDARGYAGVEFLVPEYARGLLPILVGSPLAVGNQRFLVDPRTHVAAN